MENKLIDCLRDSLYSWDVNLASAICSAIDEFYKFDEGTFYSLVLDYILLPFDEGSWEWESNVDAGLHYICALVMESLKFTKNS